MQALNVFDTPVVLVLFNRPDRIREVIQALRPVQPSRVLAVADGPRSWHPDDAHRCEMARATLDEIDWPCSIDRCFSDTNLGCDRRVPSGLDWAFSMVDRAIVLEDDILPDASFFHWAAAMLDRFGEDPAVGIISGWNPLGSWGPADADHLRTPITSIWGWACTAASWRRIQRFDLGGNPSAAAEISQLDADPIVRAHWALQLQMYRRGEVAAWDVILSLRAAMLGLLNIQSPVNLTRNTGFGIDATRTPFADDFVALLRAQKARLGQRSLLSSPPDAEFARAVILIRLLSACRNPEMAAKLAERMERGSRIPLKDGIRHHLTPFLHARESRKLLNHLEAQGVQSLALQELSDVLGRLASARRGAS